MIRFFQPDLHSQTEPVFHAVDAPMSQTVSAVVSAHYGRTTGRVEDVGQVSGAEVNSTNFRVRCEKGDFLLKRTSSSADRAKASWELERWMRDRSIPCPETVPTDPGAPIAVASDGVWRLTRFIAGNHFSGGEEELCDAARILGNLHRTLETLPASQRPQKRLDYLPPALLGVYQTLRDHQGNLASLLGERAAAPLTRDWSILENAVQDLDPRPGCDDKEVFSVCHFDFHPRNLFVRDGRVVAVLDIDSLAWMPLSAAIGFAAFKLVRQHAAHEGLAGKPAAITRAYDDFLESVAMEGLARASIDRFGRMEILRRLLYILSLNLQGDKRWDFDVGYQLATLGEFALTTGQRA